MMSFSRDTKTMTSQEEENEEELVSMEAEKQSEEVKTSERKNLPYHFSLSFHKKIRYTYPYLTAPDPVTENAANKPPANEQRRLYRIVEIKDDASNPGRIEMVSTTDFQVPRPYIYWTTVRLRRVDGENEEGVPSETVDAVMVWRRKCVIFFEERLVLMVFIFCSSSSSR